MNNPLISVIVPIFKVEDYLDKCIESIINQTYTNLEIILVDDGSPDSCPSICDSWAKRDSRIRVIHKQNGGLASARNAGLDCCTGSYISFVDADDWLEQNMYQEQLKYIGEADIIACQIYYVKDTKQVPSHSNGRVFVIDNYYKMMDAFLSLKEPDLRWEVWNKLIKRSVIGNDRFKVGQIFEDVYFNRIIFSKVAKVVVHNTPLYNYRVIRPGSINSKFNPKGLTKLDELQQYITTLINSNEREIALHYISYTMNTILGFYIQAKNFQAEKDIISTLLQKFEEYYLLYIELGGKKSLSYTLFRIWPWLYTKVQPLYVYLAGL